MDASLICDELCELDLDVQSTDEFFEVMSKKAICNGKLSAGNKRKGI